MKLLVEHLGKQKCYEIVYIYRSGIKKSVTQIKE